MLERDLSIDEALAEGAQFAMHGNHKSAIEYFRGVLIHEPNNFEALNRIGTSWFELKQWDKALYRFWRALKVDRRHPLALTNYGLCLSQLGHPDEGVAFLERAIVQSEKAGDLLSPQAKALAYNNLGNTLERLGRHADALPVLQKGIAHDPLDPFPYYNLGIVLLRLNRHREAIAALNKSLELRDPVEDSASRLNSADAHYNRGMAHFLLGDLKSAWPDYEYRLITTETSPPNLGLDPALKLAVGEPVAGRRILVHAEQGLGDCIQSMRFIQPLIDAGAEVLLIVHSPVRPLINMSNVTVMQTGEDLTNKFDRWVALMSLPLYLNIEREDQIPKPWRFEVESERIEKWANNMPEAPFRVGVCWAGNFQHKNNVHRSIPLSKFATLFDAPASFVSLQQIVDGDKEEFAKLQKKHANLSALYLTDFRDTAAVMHNLDLVITVDTSVAHVAGSVGVPTWVLVPAFSPDWRWQIERTDSPWYPNLTLLRQHKIGDWGTTLRKARDALTEIAVADRAA